MELKLVRSVKRFELRVVRERVEEYERAITRSRDVVGLVTGLLGSFDEERLVVLLLDTKNAVLGYAEAARGGVNTAYVSPASIFRLAIHVGATSVIAAHNHPSDDPAPSSADDSITERICQAGELLGIRVLDHIIVTSDPAKFFSYADACRLPNR